MKIDDIDLRSDTLTCIVKEDVLNIEWNKIGDDCYGEDILVRTLETECARLFNKEAALFMPSGTMSNQIGLRCLAEHGSEVITEIGYHICFFESAQTCSLSGIVLNGVSATDGILKLSEIQNAIKAKARWSNLYAVPKVIAIENTINTYGGKVFPFEEIKKIKKFCNQNNMSLFMDGARILNACASKKIEPHEYGDQVDLLNICFSKGIGAPFGSALIGSKEIIKKARVFRKWYGGCLHQSGLIAGIILNKLDNWKTISERDNNLSTNLSNLIANTVEIVYPVESNMVFIYSKNAPLFVEKLKENGVKAIAWQPNIVRFVTSSLVDENKIEIASNIICQITKNMQRIS